LKTRHVQTTGFRAVQVVSGALAVLGVILLVAGCAGRNGRTAATAPPMASLDRVPETLAILPFENNSVTDPATYEPLSRGLAAMLITDLTNSRTSLKIIEREKIQAILKEIALSQSGSVDNATAVQVGRILGAQAIAFGSFMVLGPQVRIDLRIIKTETSETLLGDSVRGKSNAFIELERRLADRIASSLRVALRKYKTASSSGIDAALLFSRGLDALDRGDRAEARKLFDQCIAIDPAYESQVDNLKGLQS